MALDVREARFEDAFELGLKAGGYRTHKPGGEGLYDKALCLMPSVVLDFLKATQPRALAKFREVHKAEADARLLARLASEVEKRGAIEVLRKGFKCDGVKFDLAYFRPASGLNEAVQRLYAANQFTVVRQLKYSGKNENCVDLVLFLNGLPVITAELKNPLTGQSVQDAVKQYRADRDPREPIFAFGRVVAHFAVDPDLAYMTTHLRGQGTTFLPFNLGRDGGAGNPPRSPTEGGFATGYLFEPGGVLAPESLLDIFQRFVYLVEDEDDKGKRTGDRRLIFPRYHQLDAVRRLAAHAGAHGAGQRYLIQHSAGSGKSNSIAWLAHSLGSLHDEGDTRVFDSIVVITDRKVLDRQLQRNIRAFEQVEGVVENIDKTSRQLKEALRAGKTIIVTTLQKFPRIAEEMMELGAGGRGKRFAVIIDEAHSSQTGESTRKMQQVLAVGSLEEAEILDKGDDEDEIEAEVLRAIASRGMLPNASYFAFTATPKPKTLEMFGTRREDGTFGAFSLYSMRQAIEEGFILDVLQNYTTYATYFSLLKKVSDDPTYEKRKAMSLLRSFVDLHEHTIAKKVGIMAEHFTEFSGKAISGRAKGMIVTRSRLHAVRFRLAMDEWLKSKGWPFRALVAFSGTVRDGDTGREYTEAGMNGVPEASTAEEFKKPENRILIVANKFQTGFDQPLLHTMYVDKKLGGVMAVQTLSRLNRIAPHKRETVVIDFANKAEDIRDSFQPYYDRTELTSATDPNLLHDLEGLLADAGVYAKPDIDAFAAIWFGKDPGNPANLARLYALLDPIVERWKDLQPGERDAFRSHLGDFVRLYAFLSQILPFADSDLEKLYHFGRMLHRRLPVDRRRLPVEVQRQIEIESFTAKKTRAGAIELERGLGRLEPQGAKAPGPEIDDERDALSRIIKELNDRFGTAFTDADRVSIEQLEALIDTDPALDASARVNQPENARLTFNEVVKDRWQSMIDSNFGLYKKVSDDESFARTLLDYLFERFIARRKEGRVVPAPGAAGGGAADRPQSGRLTRSGAWPQGEFPAETS